MVKKQFTRAVGSCAYTATKLFLTSRGLLAGMQLYALQHILYRNYLK